MEEPIDLIGFIQVVMERSYRWVKSACDGHTEEQQLYQPAADSNSVGWLVWHSSRVKDQVTETISGEGEVWVTEGRAERFGMAPDATGRFPGWQRLGVRLRGPSALGHYTALLQGDTGPAWTACPVRPWGHPARVAGHTRDAGGFLSARRAGRLPPWHDHGIRLVRFFEPRRGHGAIPMNAEACISRS